MAVAIAMYTVAVECAFRWALAAGLVVELGAAMAIFSMWRDDPQRAGWKAFLPFSFAIGAIWLSGLYISTRRKYTRSLEERAERLERERDAEVQIAAAAERARIAREMHDVIAHSVSVMVVQADGAAYTVEADSQRAKRAMEAIGATGRQALAEMRRMLGVLREGGDASLAPQPGVEQLTELVVQIRSAGLPVDLAVHGVPAELTAGLQLTIYRIVQEALTNVRKHAGPGATARVGLYYGDHAVEVRIRDDGRGAVPGDGRGHGLVGMRERVAVYGGSVRAEPVAGGGFEVVARLSVKEGVKV
jgi:signal transduction histidine kinase